MKYKIILADPPWKYKWGDGGNLAPETHYSTLSVEELSEIPVKEIRDKNCILALWATCPALPQALEVMKAWGFKYKTILHNWVKIRKDGQPIMGMGSYTRSGSELLLLGMRGHIKRISTKVVIPQVLMEGRRKHSQKPDIVRENLVKLFGDLPRIELFARQKIEGWTSIGYDIDGKDISGVLKEMIEKREGKKNENKMGKLVFDTIITNSSVRIKRYDFL